MSLSPQESDLYVSNKNRQAELMDTTEIAARDTFLKRFLHN